MSGRKPSEAGAWPWNEALADPRITETLTRRGRNGVIGKWRNIWLASNRTALIAAMTARVAAAAAAGAGSSSASSSAAAASGSAAVGNGHAGASGSSSRSGAGGSRSRAHASRSSSTGMCATT
jgi:hypothetical protein